MLLGPLEAIGRNTRTGGYDRSAWSRPDLAMREWFLSRATALALDTETDRNGNLWAWWGGPGENALVLGSHLDSVPSGGAWDGPLGVAAAFAAIERLERAGAAPRRPVAVVAFSDEEGARFGIACLGSRMMAGAVGVATALSLTDDDGVSLAEAMRAAGHDPMWVGPDPERMRAIGEYLELHIEQGHLPIAGGPYEGAPGLRSAGAPLGIGSAIWPHGRWRMDLAGEANHAGTTRLEDRHDPALALAEGILSVRRAAEELGVLATVGKVALSPGAVNAIPASASMWIDARGGDASAVRALIDAVERRMDTAADEESWTDVTRFDAGFASEIARVVAADNGPLPVIPSGAGHDAGVLAAAGVRAAMLFVRNPTGVSHSPEEHVDDDDVELGVRALESVLRERAL